uniref:Uncharacterized protein n=1 Tax=Anguilla anguilla TaxID=7936 RepID=A0A0E9WEK4_ANGAN
MSVYSFVLCTVFLARCCVFALLTLTLGRYWLASKISRLSLGGHQHLHQLS